MNVSLTPRLARHAQAQAGGDPVLAQMARHSVAVSRKARSCRDRVCAERQRQIGSQLIRRYGLWRG